MSWVRVRPPAPLASGGKLCDLGHCFRLIRGAGPSEYMSDDRRTVSEKGFGSQLVSRTETKAEEGEKKNGEMRCTSTWILTEVLHTLHLASTAFHYVKLS